MKKLLTLILALSMLIMTSCGNMRVTETTESTKASTTETEATTEIITAASSVLQTQATGSSASNDMDNGIYFNEDEYDKYLEFIATYEYIPENLVTYEDISRYGDFYFCLFFWDFGNHKISGDYVYILKTETGILIDMEFSNDNHLEKLGSGVRIHKEVPLDGMTDMLVCNDVEIDENTGMLYVDVGEIRYWYYRKYKELGHATWRIGDIYVIIDFDDDVEKALKNTLPGDKGLDFLRELLDPTKAEAAVAEFNVGISH